MKIGEGGLSIVPLITGSVQKSENKETGGAIAGGGKQAALCWRRGKGIFKARGFESHMGEGP